MPRSSLADWRNAVRDSRLSSRAKAVGFCLSTYMNGTGAAFPSKVTLAAGTSLSERTVDTAIVELEAAGFLLVNRTGGRKSNNYSTLLPTPQQLPGSDPNPATDDIQPGNEQHPTGQPLPPKAVESKTEGCTAPVISIEDNRRELERLKATIGRRLEP